jgi:hypothetical protein
MVNLDGLERFDAALASFRESSGQLGRAVAKLTLKDHRLRGKAGATAHDVVTTCQNFRRLYGEALTELRAELAEVSAFALVPGDLGSESTLKLFESLKSRTKSRVDGRDPRTQFVLAFKTLYFFVRAHQDSLCALICLVRSPSGTPTGDYSMTKHLGREGPVRSFIYSSVSEYPDWFFRWKAIRDRVKAGVGAGPFGSQSEIGIRFSRFTEAGGIVIDCSEGSGLIDVVDALRLSDQVQRAIVQSCQHTATPGQET